jgi:hypothetical protein
MCQAEKLVGFAGAAPGKNIEFDPTLTSILDQERENVTQGDFIKKESKIHPGLTAHWGFTHNFTLSAAVNPDFSNIEADVLELDINRRFAIYYPEKRPLFLEGASIFSTRFPALHTRTLFDPDWGIKITGKEGANSIGFFSVQDHVTNLIFPGSQQSEFTSIENKTVSSVLRWRRDVGKSSTLGILVTDREGKDYFNRLAGIDADLKITPKDRIRLQFLGSQTRYPKHIAIDFNQSKDTSWGRALDLFYHHDTKTFDWFIGYRDISANFRADLGFMPQVNFKNLEVGGGHTWYRKGGHWFTMLNVGTSFQVEKDHDNNPLYKGLAFKLNYQGPVQSSFNLTANLAKRTHRGVEFNYNNLLFDGNMRPTRSIFIFFSGLLGDGIDYANVRAGNQLYLNGFISYKFKRHLELWLGHKFEHFNVDAGRLYRASISYVRLIYHFNRRTFLRAILEYVNYKYNTDLYTFPVEPDYKHLFSQFLFSYQINPRTVLFLGYSDDYYGYQKVPLTQSNRTFFVKIGYALVL